MSIDPNSNGGLAGVVYAGQSVREPPQILVMGPEKVGKSSLATTLFDWPCKDARPFVIAVDSSGVEACAGLGYPVAHRKVKDAPGSNMHEKMDSVLSDLERQWRPLGVNGFPFSTIVFDDASSFGEILLTEDMQDNESKDPRKNYGNILQLQKRVFWRLKALNVPIIWLGWERAASEITTGSGQNKQTKREPGTVAIPGNFRQILAGWASQICILRIRKVGVNVQGADKDGNMRVLYTRSHEGTTAGGRWQHLLPDPAPAHLGMMLNAMLGLPQPQ